jgi:segregation and condensation protein A
MPPELNSEAKNALLPSEVSPPCAIILGQPLASFPKDLYIPPNALEVILETFSGPLDLLLYLIKKQNINILDIPVAKITAQYIEYINLMKQMQIELAAEYLVMAAFLMEVKSRMLLPVPVEIEAEEDDPRAELVRRLREYERFKKAALDLDALPRLNRDIFALDVDVPRIERVKSHPKIEFSELVLALKNVLSRVAMYQHHQVSSQSLSIRERMSDILIKLAAQQVENFHGMLRSSEGRHGVVVTFMAILELIKEAIIETTQNESFGTIYLKQK